MPDPSKKRPPPRGVTARGPADQSKRPARVAAQLRQELAKLVSRELADPRLEGLVVASVALTTDLRVAKVFYRLATTAQGAMLTALRDDAQKALERANPRLRREVTQRLGLRFAPELRFVYDEGQDARDRIEELLHEIAQGDAKRTGKTGKTGKK